jgi:putative addiction module CopG family antidote
MTVNLPEDLENYVEGLVQTGHYPGYSDVIQEALRQHQASRPAFGIVMTPELEKLLDEGMENLDQAKTTEELRRRK